MSDDAIFTRLRALEAKVAQLETTNARLVDVASRLFDLIGDRTVWVSEELAERDGEAAETQVALETAIRSRAPRGFKFPITVHETVVSPVTVIKNTFKKPLDEQTFNRWGEQLRYISGLAETHQLILKRNGMVDEHQNRFGPPYGTDPEPTPSAED